MRVQLVRLKDALQSPAFGGALTMCEKKSINTERNI